MNEKQKNIAKNALIEWLKHPSELGKNPSAIEYAGEFDLHRMHYYIFRFQKEGSSKWYTGVSGGYANDFDYAHCGHVFSEMKEYDEHTAKKDCMDTVEMIIAHWKKTMTDSGLYAALQENSRFIHLEEIPVQDIDKQFQKSNVYIGNVDFPTGAITVADPLAYIPANRHCLELEQKIPIGSYPVYVSVSDTPSLGLRMCAVRMKITPNTAVKYLHANGTPETVIIASEEKIIHGFPVDASMISICDSMQARRLRAVCEDFEKEYPEKDFYEDVLSPLFAASYQAQPLVQRQEGDFIEWINPIDKKKMIMVASGIGDGIYYAYWGYDEKGEICELIIPMVNPEYFSK